MALNNRLWSEPSLEQIDLSKTWFFRILSVAFIVLAAPTLSFYLRGLIGFLVLVLVAVVVGLAENSFTQVMRLVRRGVSENKGLMFFALWYWGGVILNSLTRGNGTDDWRLFVAPVIVFIALAYTFAFSHNERAYRYFQIGLILALFINAIPIIQTLMTESGIARDIWIDEQGAWLGGPSVYALFAMLLPVALWRALSETRGLRLILLLACLLIFVEISIASFATPIAMLLLSLPATLVLAMFLPGIKRRVVALVVSTLLAGIIFFGYQFTFDNPLFTPVYDRFENFLLDPTSGGYSGADLDQSRWYLAEFSLRSFEAEPLWGMGGGNTRYSEFVGGHSSLFDTLGSYGLLGGGGALVGVILVMLASAGLRFWKERNWETLLALVSISLLVVGGVVDPFWEGWLPACLLLMARPLRKSPLRPAADSAETAPVVLPYRHSRWRGNLG